MGTIQQVEPNPSGGSKVELMNNRGYFAWSEVQSGVTPKLRLGTAGFGAQIVAADGVTVILNVPETGFTPSGTYLQLTPQAVAPAGMTEGALWYSSVDHSYHGLDNNGDVLVVTSQ